MATAKVNCVMIPKFDKENYNLWKKRMMLFIEVSNPKYLVVLKKGPFIPMVIELEEKEGDIVIKPARQYQKDPSNYTTVDTEEVGLDLSLQMILIDSLDSIMYNHVVNCKDAKHIWDTIEIINEGTEEVKENMLEIDRKSVV